MPVSPACPANLPCHSDTDVCLTHSLGALSEDVIAVATLALSGARDLASHRRPSQISSISVQATPMPPPSFSIDATVRNGLADHGARTGGKEPSWLLSLLHVNTIEAAVFGDYRDRIKGFNLAA